MDIGTLLAPADPAFRHELTEIWRSRPDLEQAYPDPGSPGLVRWAAANGVLEYPDRLAAFYPPIPPAELRRTACGGRTEQSHLWTATEDLEALLSLWEVFSDRPISSIASVLDFGCGCGRVLRWFPLVVPGAHCHGCDVREASIEWCNENLTGSFFTNATSPPLALPDHSVDLVYSLSVFSHLNRASNVAWIRELARVVRPDGRILVTACGAFTLWALCRSDEHQRDFQITGAQAREYLAGLRDQEFVFHGLSGETIRALDGVEQDYGQAFLTEQFVAREWSDAVDLVGHVPASLSLLQDFYVLKPKPRGGDTG